MIFLSIRYLIIIEEGFWQGLGTSEQEHDKKLLARIMKYYFALSGSGGLVRGKGLL